MTGFKNENLSIGLYEKALPDSLDWEERLISVRDTGYSFMEISIDKTDERIERLKWDSTKKKKLREITEKIGIPLLTMCLSGNRRFPIGSSFPDIQKKGMELITDAIYFASQMGIRIVQIAGYDVVAGEKSTDLSKETFCINLKKSVKLAASLGVMLALENINNEFSDSLDKIMRYIKDINSPWLQIYPDIGNLTAMKQDVAKQLQSYPNHIAAIHVKDTQTGIVRNIPFGEGIVNFISAFKVLKNINFYGPLTIEMWSNGKSVEDSLSSAEHANKWVLEKMRLSEYV